MHTKCLCVTHKTSVFVLLHRTRHSAQHSKTIKSVCVCVCVGGGLLLELGFQLVAPESMVLTTWPDLLQEIATNEFQPVAPESMVLTTWPDLLQEIATSCLLLGIRQHGPFECKIKTYEGLKRTLIVF